MLQNLQERFRSYYTYAMKTFTITNILWTSKDVMILNTNNQKFEMIHPQ